MRFCPACQAVLQIEDRYGNTIKLDRAPSTCVLTRITSTNGRYITVTSDANSRITQISDNIGRNVGYTYDAAGRLSTVTDANGGVTTYTYDDQNRMLTIRDVRNIVYLTNQYDGAGRVLQQTEADNGTYLFNWTPAQTSQIHFSMTYGQTEGGVGGALTVVRDNAGAAAATSVTIRPAPEATWRWWPRWMSPTRAAMCGGSSSTTWVTPPAIISGVFTVAGIRRLYPARQVRLQQ